MSLVQVENLSIVYDKHEAVKSISFTVEPGEVVGFMGRNGAGKSSTLKVLGGVLAPTSGKVLIDGRSMSEYYSSDMARMVTGYCPDVGGLIPQATLREHIFLCLSMHRRLDLESQALAMVELFHLQDSLDSLVSGFSHGMSRRASVILAALASSKLLILDEPFDGVDPLGVESVKTLVSMAQSNGVAVIISTHLQDIITHTVDNVIVMSKGHILDRLPSSHLQGAEGIRLYEDMLQRAEKGNFSANHHHGSEVPE